MFWMVCLEAQLCKLEEARVKHFWIKNLLIMIVLVFGHTATAQGFSVGAGLDSPGLLEVRVGYETDDFGLRTYLTLFGLFGADIYAKVPTQNLNFHFNFRFGVGVLTDFRELGFRGVIGVEWMIAANTGLVFELRPMYFPSLWSDTWNSNPFLLVPAILLGWLTLGSFTLSLEYHF